MTIIVGFVNDKCAVLGIDSRVVQTRQYSDGTVETHNIARNKLGIMQGEFIIAHQGRIAPGMPVDMTTQDVCDKITLSARGDFETSCTTIIKEFQKYTSADRDQMIFIAGRDDGKPTICSYISSSGEVDFSKKEIVISNQREFEVLQKTGKTKILSGDFNQVSVDGAKKWTQETLQAFVENFNTYDGPIKIGTILPTK